MPTSRTVLIGLVLGSLSLAATSHSSAAPGAPAAKPPAPLKPLPAAFVQSNDAFAADLYGQLGKEQGKNVFFSPASVSTALAMTYAGAKGATAKEMSKTLHFDLAPVDLDDAFHSLLGRLDSSGGKNPVLHVANRLFVQKDLKLLSAFTSVTHDSFGADVGFVDFKAAPEPGREIIDKWVDGKTNSKIQELVPVGALTKETRLVLVNAIYFKGSWLTEFKKSSTTNEAFKLASGKTTKTPTMHQSIVTSYGETPEAQIVSIPYRADDSDHMMSMVVVLPKTADGLAKVETGLDGKKLEGFTKSLGPAAVDLALPKWKATIFSDLGEKLKTLGMKTPFDDKSADFSGITGDEPLFIAKVLHKAFIEVSEEGTEAAAATGVVVATPTSAMLPVPKKSFVADHPFLYFLRDDTTGAILFLGRTADPTSS